MRRFWILICCLACVACDKGSPPAPPTVGTPAGTETISGSERIGWDQRAADAAELNGIGYVMYVDGTRIELSGVTCGSAAAGAGFPCSARLPAISPGAHALELASLALDAGLESARSAPLHVIVAAQTVAARSTPPIVRAGLGLRSELVADGLQSPTDIAFAPDGRLFVAERAGRIRVVRDGRLLDQPALSLHDTLGPDGQLLAIALSPSFGRTHHLFAIYTAPARAGAQAFTLARFREAADTLADRAVLLDAATLSSRVAAAALRFGPDEQLYAAFDDGGDARSRLDPGSLGGKVLRLSADGTTASGAPRGGPVYADAVGAPVALDWDPPTATLWVADRRAGGAPFAFYRGAMFPDWNGRMVTASTIFASGEAAGVSVIAVGPEGAIYYGTTGAIRRLSADRAP